MTLPLFTPDDDPGPSFVGLLGRLGVGTPDMPDRIDPALVAHGTTVVAFRYVDGVVMAGDRQATAGYSIASRTVEKVLPADSHSGVAISGSAAMCDEMVHMFQLQLEHYEKVEGRPLSLDGKANQLSQMLRSHMPLAMQGLMVVPIFAGFDEKAGQGRLFVFDPFGGRCEERDYVVTGSGHATATTVIKLRHHDTLGLDGAVDVVVEALFQAADEDVATGGPDLVRGIYPTVASITADGFQRLDDQRVSDRTAVLLERLGGAS